MSDNFAGVALIISLFAIWVAYRANVIAGKANNRLIKTEKVNKIQRVYRTLIYVEHALEDSSYDPSPINMRAATQSLNIFLKCLADNDLLNKYNKFIDKTTIYLNLTPDINIDEQIELRVLKRNLSDDLATFREIKWQLKEDLKLQ